MMNNATFYRLAGICALATALTTFLLWLLPQLYSPSTSFEQGIQLSDNIYYMSKQWINFIHIPMALLAYYALHQIISKQNSVISSFGMLWFGIWGAIEMIGVAIIIFTVNHTWRKAYLSASLNHKEILKNNIDLFNTIWDSLFFVLLIAFLLGSVFYGWALFKQKGLGKALSMLFWLAVPLTLLILFSNYANIIWAGTITKWIYPVLQPLSRGVLGVFLWQHKQINKQHEN